MTYQPVRKAVIPAGGYGTRLFPATKAVKKELFPIIDRDGRAKPIILAIAEEAFSAGIESVGIVVQPGDRPLFEHFFQGQPEPPYFDKLAPKHADYMQYLDEIGQRVTFLTQSTQDGFGHAVFCARDWVGDEPFLLLLGDHVYRSNTETSCADQLLKVYQQVGQSVVSIESTPIETISHKGCVYGSWIEPDSILAIDRLVEKPSVDYARQHLLIPGMSPDECLAIFGMYILAPQIFNYLEDHIKQNIRENGEFQLTSCLDELQQNFGMLGYKVKGQSFDTGQPASYRQAVIEFAKDQG
ncbi:MAG TPA: UTP--glucose-1-phosphate uridylyltransferase [Crinalium sp.]|jgi:UTP--glucose-1-phosphate uridylyltransferase